MTRTALVTGACGFTGQHLVATLLDDGWSVVGTDLEAADRPAFYTETDNAPHPVYDQSTIAASEAEFVPADITDAETLDPVFAAADYDVVFHLASLFDYFAERETLEAVNVEGARNVAEAALAEGVDHFVHVSTLGVLGDASFDAPKDETAAYNPHNRYCETKRQQEQLLLGLHEDEGLPLTVLRPAPIYGPGNRYGVYHIPLVVSKMGIAPVFRIYPRDRQLMFPSVHVTDLCEIATFVTENRPRTVGEIYHAVSDCIQQDELVEFLGEAVDVPTVRIPIHYRLYKGLAHYTVLHSRRIERIARDRGVRPKIDAAITRYLSHNMWFANEKIRDLGYEFEYRDPKAGLWDYVTWCKSEGLLP